MALLLAAAAPVKLDAATRERLTRELAQERADHEKWVRESPGSYLATVSRKDFGEKTTLTVGRAQDNDVVLDGPDVAEHHLRVTVVGDRFQLTAAEKGATFVVEGVATRTALVMPGSVGVGRFTLRLSHQRFPAIIVQDPKSPHFQGFQGLRYFPVDFAYRYELPLTPNPKPEEVVVLSTRGSKRKALRVGWFDFTAGGHDCRLEAHRLLEPGVGENDLIVLFRDATTGKESYPVGRYVDPKPLGGGRFLLDFNEAYSPACAFSEHFNCPLPPRANVLSVAIRAGEMDSHGR